MRPTVLIVEDDRRIAALVARNLDAAGYDCHVAHDGEHALAELARRRPVLIVLDLVLPAVGGLEITRHVRRTSEVPILMLTARSSEADKVLGLELGADDYLTKPFSTAELVARVRALLRRTHIEGPARRIDVGTLQIDASRREVTRDGSRIPITTLEFDLIHFLAARRGRVYTREALMQHVWGSDRVVGERSIDNLVSRLRRKLEPDPENPRYLQTVWGAGYRFADQPEPVC